MAGDPPVEPTSLEPDLPFEPKRARLRQFVPFTAAFNASGCPALSLPLGRDEASGSRWACSSRRTWVRSARCSSSPASSKPRCRGPWLRRRREAGRQLARSIGPCGSASARVPSASRGRPVASAVHFPLRLASANDPSVDTHLRASTGPHRSSAFHSGPSCRTRSDTRSNWCTSHRSTSGWRTHRTGCSSWRCSRAPRDRR